MHRSTWTAVRLFSIALAAVAIGGSSMGDPADSEISLRPIKYADLCKTIRGLKGKVVLVDFWAEY